MYIDKCIGAQQANVITNRRLYVTNPVMKKEKCVVFRTLDVQKPLKKKLEKFDFEYVTK